MYIFVHEIPLDNKIAKQSYNIFRAACTALAGGLCGNYNHCHVLDKIN